jgi:hypothetical protein
MQIRAAIAFPHQIPHAAWDMPQLSEKTQDVYDVRMPIKLSLAALDQQRARNFHQADRLRLKNAEAIRAFVDARQISMLFPINGIVLPNVYQAVAGFAKEMTAKHDDPAISLTWNTKDQSLDKRWWFYAKLLRGKATLLSLDMLPNFYALSENFGNDEEDYLAEYEAGTLTADAKNIYEALLKHGAMHAIEIKRKAGLYGDELKARFDKALTELQTGLKVVPVGVAQAGAWRYVFIYQILSRWLPEPCKCAEGISRAEARVNILRSYLKSVVYATPKDVVKIFGWKRGEADAAITALVAQGAALSGVQIDGLPRDVILAPT